MAPEPSEGEAKAGAIRLRRPLLLAVVAGVGLGVFSILADGILPGRLFTILGNIAAPWVIVAFLVGLRAPSPGRGALAGTLTLLVGVATYYGATAVRGYAGGSVTVIWTAVALAAGPMMGLSGAAVAAGSRQYRSLAVAAPAAMLTAEAIFLLLDRRVWRYNLAAESYRLIDLTIVVALLAGAFAIPWVFARQARTRVYLLVAAGGAAGAVGFLFLRALITGF